MSVRKKHSASFKAKVALAALTSNKTITELCSEHGVHQTQINKWKREVNEGAVGVFTGEAKSEDIAMQKKLHELHAKKKFYLLINAGKLPSYGVGKRFRWVKRCDCERL